MVISVLRFVIRILLSCLLIRRNLLNYLSILMKVFISPFFVICVFYLKIFIIMSSRKNLRFVKVKTVMSSDDVKLILTSNAVNSRSVLDSVINSSADIRKNNDDNTALIQKDILSSSTRLEGIFEKVLYVGLINIILSAIILCIC